MKSLEQVDLSKFKMISNLELGGLSANCRVTYPELTEFHTYDKKTSFACTQDVFDRQETKDFIKNNIKYIDNNSFAVEGQYMPHPWERHEDVRWMDIWKKNPW